MKIIYLMSGPDKVNGFDEKIRNELKNDLKGTKSLTFIVSSPDSFAKNDMYINGNGQVIGVKNFLREISEIETFNILDNRVDIETGSKFIQSSDVLYFLGGDPFEQIKYINNNGYDKLLKEFNGIILGASAGAMNLGKISYYSKDDDYDKSLFYDGLGITNITIDPHFDINNGEQFNQALTNSKGHEIIGVPNNSAIRICNEDIRYVNTCYKFVDGKVDIINE